VADNGAEIQGDHVANVTKFLLSREAQLVQVSGCGKNAKEKRVAHEQQQALESSKTVTLQADLAVRREEEGRKARWSAAKKDSVARRCLLVCVECVAACILHVLHVYSGWFQFIGKSCRRNACVLCRFLSASFLCRFSKPFSFPLPSGFRVHQFTNLYTHTRGTMCRNKRAEAPAGWNDDPRRCPFDWLYCSGVCMELTPAEFKASRQHVWQEESDFFVPPGKRQAPGATPALGMSSHMQLDAALRALGMLACGSEGTGCRHERKKPRPKQATNTSEHVRAHHSVRAAPLAMWEPPAGDEWGAGARRSSVQAAADAFALSKLTSASPPPSSSSSPSAAAAAAAAAARASSRASVHAQRVWGGRGGAGIAGAWGARGGYKRGGGAGRGHVGGGRGMGTGRSYVGRGHWDVEDGSGEGWMDGDGFEEEDEEENFGSGEVARPQGNTLDMTGR
jgi:hypothetical protein